MGRNRNKYAYLSKKNVVPFVFDLPIHIVEHIVNKCDPFTRARCAILNRSFFTFVGDARPSFITNQTFFLRVIEDCCTKPEYKCFYLRVLTPDYHMIISDEDGHVVFIDIMFRRHFRKPLKRSYRKQHCVDALKAMLKGTRLLKGTPDIAGSFFRCMFENVIDVSMTTHPPPSSMAEWKIHLQKCHN